MIPSYAVIHEAERDDFEKKTQLSYGYGAVDIYYDMEDAIDGAEWLGLGYVVEEISEDGRQVVHRI